MEKEVNGQYAPLQKGRPITVGVDLKLQFN